MSDFNLLQQWERARLGDVTLKIADRDHYTPTYVETGVLMVSPKDFDEAGRIDFTHCQYISPIEHERNRRKTDIAAGDLVFTRIGARLGKACLVTPLMPEFSLLHSAVMIRPAPHRVVPEYLLFVLKGHELQSQIGREIQSIGVPDLGLDKINAFVVTLPPLPQQRKIARILTTVDNLIEKTEALIAKYQAIKQGMMHDLFTRGVDEHGHLRPPYEQAPELYKQSELGWIPKEWEISQLGSYARLQGGVAFSSGSFREDGVPLIRISNIKETGLSKRDIVYLPYHFLEKYADFCGLSGDIVIAMSGATTGKNARIHNSDLPLLINQRVGRFVISSRDSLRSDFLYYTVNSKEFQDEIVIDSIGGAQPNISSSHVERIRVRIPPLGEQTSISERLLSIEADIRAMIRHVQKLVVQKIGLMQDLLTGKVRVKTDDAEEVAG